MEQKKQRQTMRISDEELQLLNDTFSEREDLLFVLRKFLLQGELNEKESEAIKRLAEPRIFKLIKKIYFPELDLETPLSQMTDLWMQIPTKDVEVDNFGRLTDSWQMFIDYLTQRFDLLEGKDIEEIKLSDFNYSKGRDARSNLANLGARNSIIHHIDFNTHQLFLLAGQKKETASEIKERLSRDSSK